MGFSATTGKVFLALTVLIDIYETQGATLTGWIQKDARKRSFNVTFVAAV